ncbi:MAG TPA: ABC transporter substrate-binding protein, partial [Bacteroidia bacterium]|nr:ABC transporter substrate-binding protein [Bacteroidia bacterium]
NSVATKIDSLDYNYHTVVHGETVYSLSKKAEMSVSKFADLNPASKNGLKVGEIVRTPKNKTDDKMTETEIKNANPAVKKFESVSTKTNTKVLKTDTIIKKNESVFPVDSIIKKDNYNIALFLPFNLDGIDSINVDAIARGSGTIPPHTKIALSFYEGALMAIDSLKKQGFKCSIFVYSYNLDAIDSTKDVYKKIFLRPEFSSMNLIIGPLYSVAFNRVEKLAKAKNIPIVSPFIQQNKILFGNPNAFKAEPSEITELDSLAMFAATSYTNQNIIIIKNDNSENNKNADLFKNKFLKAFKNNHPEVNVATFISKDFSGVKKYFSSTKKNIVVMLSEDQPYVTNFINSLANVNNQDSIILFGMQAIHRFDNLDLTYLNTLQFHFATNIFVDYANKNTENFIENYRTNYLTEPNRYVYQGFDVTFYCLNALKNYGINFVNNLPQLKMQGIQTSFDFYKTDIESGYENKAIYILEYKDLELRKAIK